MKIREIVSTIFIIFKRILMVSLKRASSLFIVSLLMFHLCIIQEYLITTWQLSILYDKPSQDDDKSSQEKKK